jgi:rhodanese-related sulfurtransferase
MRFTSGNAPSVRDLVSRVEFSSHRTGLMERSAATCHHSRRTSRPPSDSPDSRTSTLSGPKAPATSSLVCEFACVTKSFPLVPPMNLWSANMASWAEECTSPREASMNSWSHAARTWCSLTEEFKGAIVPDVATTNDFVNELDSGKYDHLKHRPIVTYCTGGVRCEVLSSLMKRRGFDEVYQINGGIVRYGEEYGDAGLWEGSLYIFDARMNHEFSDDSKVLGCCESCDAPTSKFHNCDNLACRKLILLCASCASDTVSTNCGPGHDDVIGARRAAKLTMQ